MTSVLATSLTSGTVKTEHVHRTADGALHHLHTRTYTQRRAVPLNLLAPTALFWVMRFRKWLGCWTQAQKLVAVLLRVARVTAGLAESNGIAYRRVYDSRHLQADCQEPDQLRNPTLGNRVGLWATFFYKITRLTLNVMRLSLAMPLCHCFAPFLRCYTAFSVRDLLSPWKVIHHRRRYEVQ